MRIVLLNQPDINSRAEYPPAKYSVGRKYQKRENGKIEHWLISLVLLVFIIPLSSHAQVPVTLNPYQRQEFFNTNGLPLAAGCIFTYQAGTSTPLATYTDSTGLIQNANPLILDSAGYGTMWLSSNAYKFVAVAAGGTNCATGLQQWTLDNVTPPPSLGANNLWTGNQTFSGTVTFNGLAIFNAGGTLNGIYAGSPTFTGNVTMTAGQNAVTAYILDGVVYVDGVKYPLTTPAIAAASIQAAASAGGKNSHLILPPGTISVSVDPSGCINLYDGQWISGSGKYATTVQRASGGSANTSMFCIQGGGGYGTTGNVTFSDFGIDGNATGQTGGADNINGGAAAGLTVRNMRLINSWTNGVGLFPTSGAFASDIDIEDDDFNNNGLRAGCVGITLCLDLNLQNPQNVKILHNHSSGSQNFAVFRNQSGAGNLEIGDNTIIGGLGFVVALGAGSTGASGANIHDNIISMAATANENVFDLANWSNVIVHGNHILTMGTCCSGVGDLPPAQRITVTSNTIYGSPTLTTNNCIGLGGSVLVIEGNFCQGAGGAGIELAVAAASQSKNIIISGNIVKNNSQQTSGLHGGIETFLTSGGSAALSGVIIEGNRVYDDQGSPTQGYGIALAPSLGGQLTGYSNFTITGNDLRGNITSAIVSNLSGATGMLISDNPGDVTLNTGLTSSAALNAGGAQATLSGTLACVSITGQTGGAWSGSFQCTSGTAATIITITPGTTAPHGWACTVEDITKGQMIIETSYTNTTCVVYSGAAGVNANDFFTFSANAF